MIDYHTALLSTTLFSSTSERPTTFVVDSILEGDTSIDANGTKSISIDREVISDNDTISVDLANNSTAEDTLFESNTTTADDDGKSSHEENVEALNELAVTLMSTVKVADGDTHKEDSRVQTEEAPHHIQEHIFDVSHINGHNEEDGRAEYSGMTFTIRGQINLNDLETDLLSLLDCTIFTLTDHTNH